MGRADEAALTAEIVELATQYGRYGYRRITALLHTAGWAVNGKRGDEAHLPARPLNVLGRSGARSFRLTLWIALMTTRRVSGIAGSRF